MITLSEVLSKVDDITAVAIIASTLMVFNKRTETGEIAVVLRSSGLEEGKESQLGDTVVFQVVQSQVMLQRKLSFSDYLTGWKS